MNKLSFFILLYFLHSFQLIAQTTITISGTVTDLTNNNPIANHQVTIVITDSVAFNFQQNFTTNSSGFYTVTIQNFPSGGALIHVSTIDCNSILQQKYLSASPYIANFSICVTPPACQASFISVPDSSNQLLIYFTDQTIGNPTSWLWDFGDSTSSTIQHPSHTYTQNGVYAVYLLVYCSNTVSTYSDTIIVSGGSTGCQANFSSFPDSINPTTIHFQDLSIGTPVSWYWKFGDSTTSTQQHPSHTYFQSGSYNVTLMIAGPGCQSSFSDSVYVNVSCSNSFTYSGSGFQFSFQGAVNSPNPTFFTWNFGDNSPIVSGQNVNHYYNSPGNYQVCLSSVSTNPIGDSCFAQSCQNIVVPAGPTSSLFGQVFLDTINADTGFVVLYHYNSFDSVFVATDTSEIIKIMTSGIQISRYYFDQLPYGKYLVKSCLYPSSMYFNNYMPTYSGNTHAWDAAIPVIIDSIADTLGSIMPVNMNKINTPSGNTTINGSVLEGTGNTPGNPVPDVPIYLIEYGIVVVDFTLSDQNGFYEFNYLETKHYHIYAEIINKQTFPLNIHPDGSGIPFIGFNIFVNSNTITGLKTKRENTDEINVYPNPFTDIFSVEIDLDYNTRIDIKIYTIEGVLVYSNNGEFLNKGKSKIDIRPGSLPGGIYLISVQSKEGWVLRRKIIKNY